MANLPLEDREIVHSLAVLAFTWVRGLGEAWRGNAFPNTDANDFAESIADQVDKNMPALEALANKKPK